MIFRVMDYYKLKNRTYLKGEISSEDIKNGILANTYQKFIGHLKTAKLDKPNLLQSYYVLKNTFPRELLR